MTGYYNRGVAAYRCHAPEVLMASTGRKAITMRKKVRKCECLGGPLDGRVMKVDGPVMFVEMNGDDGRHFYRLCTCSLWDERRPDEMRWATYWHYLGDRMTDSAPKLVPHRRMFR